MSAFVVSTDHITAMIAAGLTMPGTYGPLRWLAPVADTLETLLATETHRRGDPWGPDAITAYNARKRELTHESADRVGQMLLSANVASVNYRYDDHETESIYTFRMHGAPKLTAVGVLKAIQCFEYQSCETPEWEFSEAFAFCTALRHCAIGKLPGYDDAPWEVEGWRGRRYSIYTRR